MPYVYKKCTCNDGYVDTGRTTKCIFCDNGYNSVWESDPPSTGYEQGGGIGVLLFILLFVALADKC